MLPNPAEDFTRSGFVRIPGAIDVSPASPAGRLLRRTLRDQGWLGPNGLKCPPGLTFTAPTRVGDMATVAPGLWQAVTALLGGADRIAPPARISNAYGANFQTYQASEWQVAGDFFVHHPDSPEQALLIVVLWSDVAAGEGATELAPDATGPILRHLREHPRGLRSGELPVPAFVAETTERLELTGNAGDAWILHPRTPHRRLPNPAGPPNFTSNPVVALREPLRLNGLPNASPLERLTQGLLRAPFHTDPNARRQRFQPARRTPA